MVELLNNSQLASHTTLNDQEEEEDQGLPITTTNNSETNWLDGDSSNISRSCLPGNHSHFLDPQVYCSSKGNNGGGGEAFWITELLYGTRL